MFFPSNKKSRLFIISTTYKFLAKCCGRSLESGIRRQEVAFSIQKHVSMTSKML